ncbi:MAG: glycogen debranching protein GlgX [Pirellulales bacterium]|nr:glycogen debranching protein GlgX [Pirellulales bacterium]
MFKPKSTTPIMATIADRLGASPVFTVARGHCRPFGATVEPSGVNFALFSRNAQRVHLLFYQEGKNDPIAELPLDPSANKTGDVWHIFVADLPHDVLYAYRVFGPSDPPKGHRFDPKAILLDPYAKALSGGQTWGSPDVSHELSNGYCTRRCRIVSGEFDWEGDVPLNTPMNRTVIYELHVRGYTCDPSSGATRPGTFLGLCEKIPHLKSLGITAVQLMPVAEFDELDQYRKNPVTGEPLKNFWGYSPISFFAPKASYASDPGEQVREFKQMVKLFHQVGIEVILDVVYNHTSEGNADGSTVSFRGLDNSIYYMLDKQGRYHNFSGCGNTLNCNHPVVRDLIIDCLSNFVAEYHVDGFRFDLASILGRGTDGRVLEDPPLIRHIAEHPVLAGTKLIAEAWDAAGLHQLGKFPAWGRWAELNGMFRDDVRHFVRSDPHAIAPLAKRICGSLDIYGDASRHPYHSINFITCHDGFTLNDLVSYNDKHNWENGEDDQDGCSYNVSWNCGIEGPTDDPEILDLRRRQMKNYFAILMVSQGVPFILHGDEFARTQNGNNNAYCQDNPTTWIDWRLAKENADLLRFARMMIALRMKHFAISREEFVNRTNWHGTQLGDPDWTGESRALAFQLHGWHEHPDVYVMLNAHWEPQRFALPSRDWEDRWRRLVDTSLASPEDIVEGEKAVSLDPADNYVVNPRTTVILTSPS